MTPDAVARLGDLAFSRWAATCLAGVDVLQMCDSGGPAVDLVHGASSFTCVVAHQGIADAVAGEFDGIAVRCAPPDRLPFAAAAFGGAVCPAAIVATDPEAVLAELARVLRPDGVLVVTAARATDRSAGRVDGGALVGAVRKQFGHVVELEQRDCFVSMLDARSGPEAGNPASGRDDTVQVRLAVDRTVGPGPAILASGAPLADLGLPAADAVPLDLARWRAAGEAQAEVEAGLRRRAQSADLTVERDFLLEQLFLSEQTLASALDNASRAEVNMRRAREELVVVQTRLHETLQELGLAQQQVAALRSSTSWRATEPLRQVSRIVGLAERST